jgi:NAD(P)H-hydrate epimerase
VYTTAAVRAADRHAIEQLGIPAAVLMARAGGAAFAHLVRRWPAARRLLVLAGPGNNGGDAYVLARLAGAAGLKVTLVAPAGAAVPGPARAAEDEWAAAGGVARPWADSLLTEADVVVDGLLGTGLAREVGPPFRDLIGAVNAAGTPVLALDVPSGLDSDSGHPRGIAVRAALTVSFLGRKQGCWLGDGPDHVGEVVLEDLGVPAMAFAGQVPSMTCIDDAEVAAALPRRARGAHKGTHGRVLVIAGGAGMPGAARLAGEAALRSGAGLVTVATWPAHAAALAIGRPELICLPVETPRDLAAALAAADVVAVGPGLGTGDWARGLLEAAFASTKPLVVDADALNGLARAPTRRATWCLTPHPGEAGRLLGTDAASVQRDRFGAVRALVGRYGGVAVLKGAGTLVAAEGGPVRLCTRGNPGMAVAGMGDVLTGVIAALAAQQATPGSDLAAAAAVGVEVHARAGDRAARRGERGLLASDVLIELPACVNPTP